MAQEIKGYYLTKKELTSINFMLTQAIQMHDKIVSENDEQEKKELLQLLLTQIEIAKKILNY